MRPNPFIPTVSSFAIFHRFLSASAYQILPFPNSVMCVELGIRQLCWNLEITSDHYSKVDDSRVFVQSTRVTPIQKNEHVSGPALGVKYGVEIVNN